MRQSSIRAGFRRYAVVGIVAVGLLGLLAPAALARLDASEWNVAPTIVEPAKPAKKKPVVRVKKQPKARGLKPNRWITGSRYERTTDVRVLFRQGCRAGRERVNGLVILAFGKPAYDGHSYGTVLFSNRFASNRQITRATRAYATGYARCVPRRSTAKIVLARGTSNYSPSTPSTYKAGRKWARETMRLARWLRQHPKVARRVRSAAAIDAEPAWDRGFRQTYRFFRGFRSARTGYLLYNFGSLDGGVGSIWSLRQAFYVAGGMKDARVVPEIYFRSQAEQWAELARLAIRTYRRPVRFAGVMTQVSPGCRRSRCGMGPREAHLRLGRELKRHPATRKQVRMLASVTNIR
jgi:hypothetical protein